LARQAASVEGRLIYGIEVGVIVWSLSGEDIGKKIALPGIRPTIVVMEQPKKRPVKKAKHSDWLDQTRFLLKGFR